MINGIGSSTGALLGGVANAATGGVTRLVGPRTQTSSALTTSAQIVADGAPIETDRIASLRAAIRAGSYRADPSAIASRMIAGDLGAGQ
jgi:negative regulator of flagellin synthesis FlgM